MSLIWLGLIQGITEFLPVSSSGHLVIAQHFLKINLPGVAFEAYLHLVTALAVIVLFKKEIKEMFISFIQSIYKLFQGKNFSKILKEDRYAKFAWFLVISSVPAALLGYSFDSYVEILFDSALTTSLMLFLTGILLWFGNKYYSKGDKNINTLTYKDAIFIGLAQAIAIIPGISRSGLTVLAGLQRNLDREFAAQYSFLLSVPIILGAALLKIGELPSSLNIDFSSWIFSGVVAFISSYGVMKVFIRLLKNRKIYIFSYYLWALSILTSGLILFKGY